MGKFGIHQIAVAVVLLACALVVIAELGRGVGFFRRGGTAAVSNSQWPREMMTTFIEGCVRQNAADPKGPAAAEAYCRCLFEGVENAGVLTPRAVSAKPTSEWVTETVKAAREFLASPAGQAIQARCDRRAG